MKGRKWGSNFNKELMKSGKEELWWTKRLAHQYRTEVEANGACTDRAFGLETPENRA